MAKAVAIWSPFAYTDANLDTFKITFGYGSKFKKKNCIDSIKKLVKLTINDLIVIYWD